MAASLLVLSCYLKRKLFVLYQKAGILKIVAFRKAFVWVKLHFTWCKTRAKCCFHPHQKHVHVIPLPPGPELIIGFIKGVFPDVENGLLKQVQRILPMQLLVDPAVEQQGGNAGGLLVPGGLIGPPGAADHPCWAGGRRDGHFPVSSNCSPPLEDALADKTLCAKDVRKGVSRRIRRPLLRMKPVCLWWERQLITAGFVRFTGTPDFDAVCLRPRQFPHRLAGFFRSHNRIQMAALLSPRGSAARETAHPNNFSFVQRLWWLMTGLGMWPGRKPLQEVSSDTSTSDSWLCAFALM